LNWSLCWRALAVGPWPWWWIISVWGRGIFVLSLLYSVVLVQLLALDAVLSIATETLQLWITAIFLVLLFALYIGYFVLFETLWFGQSPGKRYTKIRVIRDDGQPERITQATLRSLLRPVDDILFVGFFCICSRPRKNGWETGWRAPWWCR
jgi:uncharacterized RDD family membrane protein YckC